MTQRRHMVIISVFVLFAGLIAAENPKTPQLRTYRYDGSRTASTLKLYFTGRPTYVHAGANKTHTLEFTGTSIARALVNVRPMFHDGAVLDVVFSEKGNDGGSITINLRKEAAPTITESENGRLVILQFTTEAAASEQPVAIRQVQPKKRPVEKDKGRSASVVSIATLPKQQAAQEANLPALQPASQLGGLAEAGATTNDATVSGTTRQSQFTSGTTATTSAAALIASIIFSLVSTAIVLKFISTKIRKGSSTTPYAQVAQAHNAGVLRPVQSARAPSQAQAEQRSVVNENDDLLDSSDRFAGLIRRYERSQEEESLSKRFSTTPIITHKLAALDKIQRSPSKKKRIGLAKKLGVGKGELEFAQQLKQLKRRATSDIE